MLKSCLTAMVFVLPLFLFGQTGDEENQVFDREFRFVMDNDVLTSYYRDQYYTSGLFAYIRKLKKSSNPSIKIIGSSGLIHRIYTPKKLSWDEIDELDRPYAGQVSFILGREYYTVRDRFIKLNLELGITGPASLTGPIQEWWHTILGLQVPRGWEYQIGNTPTINLYLTHAKQLVDNQRWDVTSETNVSLGTIFNDVRQELVFRFGSYRKIHNSIQYNGRLGTVKPKTKVEGRQEFYFLFSPGLEYNIHNTTIEGSSLGGEDPHTEKASNFIYQNRMGVMTSWTNWDLHVYHYWRTRETLESDPHTYVGIHVNYRF